MSLTRRLHLDFFKLSKVSQGHSEGQEQVEQARFNHSHSISVLYSGVFISDFIWPKEEVFQLKKKKWFTSIVLERIEKRNS